MQLDFAQKGGASYAYADTNQPKRTKMSRLDAWIENASLVEERMGYTFQNKELLALAFTHRSYVNEHEEVERHNERLEFLGDTVIGLLMSEFLYRKLADRPEGELSILRSRLVDASACYRYANSLEVEDFVLVGRGERLSDGRGRENILANLLEAIVGAIYLDGGLEPCRKFLFSHFMDEIESIMSDPDRNWKAVLQDYAQKQYQSQPSYEVLEESGPDHSKHFKIAAVVDNREMGTGEGSSKKEAQQNAARDAVERLEQEEGV